jgi:hypothetical protein
MNINQFNSIHRKTRDDTIDFSPEVHLLAYTTWFGG